MSEHHAPQHLSARIGLVVFGICRGVAVVLLALALYVALTNWEGGGGVWALRYFVLALAVFAVGLGTWHWLVRGR